MTEQLRLVGVAPPTAQEAATGARTGRVTHACPPSGHPPRPTPTAVLRARCPVCGQWPAVGETTGKLMGHKYPKWDFRNRRGRCAGAGTHPPDEPKWAEPVR